MHPMLISVLADQIARERSRSCVNGLSRSFAAQPEARGPRSARRSGIWLLLHPLIARRGS
jgi:hypothetical protein